MSPFQDELASTGLLNRLISICVPLMLSRVRDSMKISAEIRIVSSLHGATLPTPPSPGNTATFAIFLRFRRILKASVLLKERACAEMSPHLSCPLQPANDPSPQVLQRLPFQHRCNLQLLVLQTLFLLLRCRQLPPVHRELQQLQHPLVQLLIQRRVQFQRLEPLLKRLL
jgi:hypothetical protein